jgi:inorganic pyrophosphatase
VPIGDPRYDEIKDLEDLPSHIPNLIAHFFQEYKKLEKKKFAKVIGWFGAQEAKKIIKDGIENFRVKRR